MQNLAASFSQTASAADSLGLLSKNHSRPSEVLRRLMSPNPLRQTRLIPVPVRTSDHERNLRPIQEQSTQKPSKSKGIRISRNQKTQPVNAVLSAAVDCGEGGDSASRNTTANDHCAGRRPFGCFSYEDGRIGVESRRARTRIQLFPRPCFRARPPAAPGERRRTQKQLMAALRYPRAI